MELVRLNKFLSSCGVASRRKADELIASGQVAIDGKVVRDLGTKIDPDTQRVTVNDTTVKSAERGVLLFYKPRGVISTMSDPEGRRCLADFLTARYKSYFPVGRLDYESEGLVILTNDGELADRLLHPRYEQDRVYEITVKGRMSDRAIDKLRTGVSLEDGSARASNVKVLPSAEQGSSLEITVREGRNRLVRRMCEAVGYEVVVLKRLKHGPFALGNVQPREVRKLSQAEYEQKRRTLLEIEAKPRETTSSERAPDRKTKSGFEDSEE